MSTKSSRRVKGKRISREFIIGSEAWKLSEAELKNPNNQQGATSGWRVYVRPVPNGPALTPWLKKVQFNLHETFQHPTRSVEATSPATGGFELEETAYGGFSILIKLYFQPSSGEKWQSRSHFLTLDPYSFDPDPEKAQKEREEMERQNLIRSEQVEVIEFSEPNEALWDALTADDQWDYLRPARAKSRSKARSGNIAKMPDYPLPPNGEYAAGLLPDRPLETGHVWSKETEDLLVEQLKHAEEQCEEELIKTLDRSKELGEFVEKVKAGHEVDAKLRAVWESLPHKKKG